MFERKQEEEIAEVLDLRDHTLDALKEKSRIIDSMCSDYNVTKANNNTVRLTNLAQLKYVADENEIREAQLSRYSLGQLGSKIGVPARYLEKCISSGRIELAQDNVNSWLEDFNKDLFIREYGGSIRGILSSKYSVCDSHDILDVVDDVLDLSKYNIKGSFLTEERLHVRLVQKEMLNINGEDLFAGITIDSSDVGRSILNCNFMIFKQVCTNGLIVAKSGGALFQQKHVGISAEEFAEGLRNSLKYIPEITDKVCSLIESKRTGGKLVKDIKDEQEVKEFLQSLRDRTRLSEESANKVIDLMNNRYTNTKWGLINSLTEVAQDFTLERRLEIERYAGSILIA